MSEMPSQYSFPCTHCGADCLCPERVVKEYAGLNVTRWCDTCRRMFDVLMPVALGPDIPA
jgi:hypothetical protein